VGETGKPYFSCFSEGVVEVRLFVFEPISSNQECDFSSSWYAGYLVLKKGIQEVCEVQLLGQRHHRNKAKTSIYKGLSNIRMECDGS